MELAIVIFMIASQLVMIYLLITEFLRFKKSSEALTSAYKRLEEALKRNAELKYPNKKN